MRRLFTLLAAASLLVMLAACGGAEAPTATVAPTATTAPTATVAPTATSVPPTATTAPTATVAPTATTAPTATVVPTVAPTATVAPTKAAATAPVGGGSAVIDSSGKCQMTLPSAFKASGTSGTYATADNLALLTFTGTDTPGLSLDAATGAFIQGFQTVVTGYAETGRQTTKDARGDVQIVTFTGAISEQQAKGVFYFVQNGGVLCSLVALAIPPGDTQYGDAAQQAAESLRVIKGGTSSAAPSSAPAASAAPSVAPSAAPSVAPTAAVAGGGGSAVTDSSGKCQMTLPAVFKPNAASAGTYSTADNLALLTFTGTDTPGLNLDAATGAFIQGFQTVVSGYAETGRQTTKDARGDVQIVTFTGAVGGQQAKGVFYFVQNGGVLCSLVALAIPPGDTQYGDAAQQAAESLQVIKPNTSYKLP